MRPSRSAAELLVGSASAGSLLGRPTSTGRPPSAGSGRGVDARRPYRSKTAFQLKGLTKHEFGHALGDIGLRWEDTIVTSVDGQAKLKGIRPGWKIYMVDGQAVNSSEDIWGAFQEAKWQWRNIVVWFVTDMMAIRAEAARARAAKIQAETERLARLPFEGPQDTRHLEQLKEEFKFQGWVEKPEHRAINVAQLRQVLGWSSQHCHRWRDPRTRVRLSLDIMNMYQLNYWVTKPATQEKQCALFEMVAKEKQTPSWYVVQWWGEKVANLLTTLEAHLSLHSAAEHSGFWIGAFANRQHTLQSNLAEGYRGTSYWRAMAAARFHILLYLDPKTDHGGPATSTSRLWCNFELSMCLDEPSATIDLATVQSGKAVVVTRGLTQDEQDSEKRSPGAGYKAKEQRERAFSIEIVEKILAVTIQKAEVTETSDYGRILCSIAGRDPSLPAPEDCEQYTKVNKRLRAMFALTCWRRVMAISGDDNIKDLQLKMTDVVRNDVWREAIDLSVAFMAAGAEKLLLLLRTLPPNLKDCVLDLCGLNIGDDQLLTLANTLPTSLEDFQLNLQGNADISNVGIANFVSQVPPKVRRQGLDLKNTGVSKEFQDKADTLDGIKSAIYEESQRGNMCTTVSLVPLRDAPRGRMAFATEKSKCY